MRISDFCAIVYTLLLLLILTNCQNQPTGQARQPATDTIATEMNLPKAATAARPLYFETDTIRRRSSTCDQADGPCAEVSIYYHLAKGSRAEVASIINDSLRYYMAGMAMLDVGKGQTLSLTQAADRFVQEYDSLEEKIKLDSEGWTNDIRMQIDLLTEKVVSIHINDYNYTGGAHGNHFSKMLVFDLRNGKRLYFAHIFEEWMPVELMLEELFLADVREKADDPSLSLNNFFWDKGFQWPDAFGLTEQGARFYYDPYEAAPYSYGPIDLLIPYERLDSIMNREMVF